jgi:hypothetical protein
MAGFAQGSNVMGSIQPGIGLFSSTYSPPLLLLYLSCRLTADHLQLTLPSLLTRLFKLTAMAYVADLSGRACSYWVNLVVLQTPKSGGRSILGSNFYIVFLAQLIDIIPSLVVAAVPAPHQKIFSFLGLIASMTFQA